MKKYSQNCNQQANTDERPIAQEKYEIIISKQNQYLLSLFDQKISKLSTQTIFQSYSHENKSHYIGQFKIKNGKRLKHGLGKLTSLNGFIYIGQWANNIKQGNGIQIDQDGNRYQGEFSLDQRNGFGIQKLIDGNKYQGQWKDNFRHGKGKQICAFLKETYQGQFQVGKRHGKGRAIYKSGDMFEGHWKNNIKEGPGIVIFYNGDVFKGQWKHNKSSGRCSIHYKNDDHFIGEYENGKRKGFGTYIFASGQKIQAQWQDQHDSIGKLFYTNGQIYQGQLLKGERHGWGKYLYQNGDIYQGQWINGEKSGFGQYYSGSKKEFTGIWSHNCQLYGQYQNLTQKDPEFMNQTQITIRDHAKKPFNNKNHFDELSTPKAQKEKKQQFFQSKGSATTKV